MNFEKKTDLIVFSLLRSNNFVDGSFKNIEKNVKVWAKKSENTIINKLLSESSKNLKGNKGYPEYLILDEKNKFVIVIENKRETKHHVKEPLQDTKYVDKYAVNGALWYGNFLAKEFDVFAIGISGNDKEDIIIDTYFCKKKEKNFKNIKLKEIFDIEIYRDLIKKDIELKKSKKDFLLDLNKESKEINKFLRSKLNIAEHERLYILGSILYALEERVFRITYEHLNDSEQLSSLIFQTVERKIKASNLKDKDMIINELKPVLTGLGTEDNDKLKNEYPNGVLLFFIQKIRKILFQFYENKEIDILSSFFNVFLSYATKGGSDLGIVLTPTHITDLFCEIADINSDSKLLDPCAGTAGFLASAWKRIFFDEKIDENTKNHFRRNNLIGVDNSRSIYTIAALNMFLKKDGKSNLIRSDCFDIKDKLKKYECNVGFINPPYSDEVYSEISFIELMLDCLLPDSIGVAIVSVNSVSKRTKIHNDIIDTKRRILKKHSLIASIQMPSNLFYPKGTETVILVFKTGNPNNEKTWLSKFDDGYELIKHRNTRTPTEYSDEKISIFLKAFKTKSKTSFSFKKEMNEIDQWVYTVHEDFDYKLDDNDFQETINEFVSFQYINNYE